MKYCLIGEKLSHSYSKYIHEKLGLNYSLKEIKKSKLSSFFKNCEYNGFNVTIPYKKEVIPYLKSISKEAKQIGAINTIINNNGEFYGYNTDIYGLRYTLERKGVSVYNKCVMILGSGGASNTATTLCELDGAKKVIVVSRSGEVNYSNYHNYVETEIIINATPVGMYPNVDNSPIDISKLPNLKYVFDCIYNPYTTNLLLQAKKLNVVYGNGIPMLVEQALCARDIWLNTKHDYKLTEEIIKDITLSRLNVVLVGMPSAGKSNVGKLLSKALNKEFYDCDVEVNKKYGLTPSEIILTQGEKAFRDIESEVIKELSLKSGAVIALGGGGVLREENIINLKRNSIIIYIERDLSLLIDSDRPISKKTGIENLYNERKEIYNKCCDFKVENNKEMQDCVNEVIKVYENISC